MNEERPEVELVYDPSIMKKLNRYAIRSMAKEDYSAVHAIRLFRDGESIVQSVEGR